MNYDMLKLSVEGLSGGKNTILLDDKGMPSFMVRIPKFKDSDVDLSTQNIHDAFLVDGVEKNYIYISKYQNIVKDDRAYSLPLMDPKVYLNFDQAKAYSENKGLGWHLMTNAERAAIALWCKKNGTMPRGNNNYGQDHSAPHEKGIPTYTYDEGATIGRVATGSGPASWAHDGTTNGIYDLNGNVREWVGGMRLVNGEIQVIPYNNAAMQVNQDPDSTLWKAILQDGSLVEPGTAGTLKYDATNVDGSGGIQIGTDVANQTAGDPYASETLETIAAKSGITIPSIVKALGLAPLDADHGGDRIYMRNLDERLPMAGGNWGGGSVAGVFCLHLHISRSNSGGSLGFRSAYVDL